MISPSTIKNNVLIGLNNYLFLFDGGQKSFKFSTGELQPSIEDVSNFLNNLQQRNTFLSKHSIPFFHIIYPSKEIVLKEEVPSPWREKIQSLYLSHYLSEKSALQDISIYPIKILMDLNRTEPVFRTLDTHMTDFGSMAITQHVLHRWGLQYDTDRFFTVFQCNEAGDLSKMLGTEDKSTENSLRPKFYFQIFDNRTALPGNTNNVRIIHNPESTTNKIILIFGDSFINFSLIFFSPIFRDIVYVRSATFQSDMVELMAPDFVISSNAERYLCKVEADAASKPMLFMHYGKANYAPPPTFSEAYAAQFSWRHHRSTYEAWSRKMLAGSLSWEGLGVCHPNQQVDVLDLAGNFRSTGIDPYLTFQSTSISPDKRYVLEIDLKSDVDSFAAVYFQVEGDERFSESKTVKLPVSMGDNHLQFYLSSARLKPAIRIDPLACQGSFSIGRVMLRVVE